MPTFEYSCENGHRFEVRSSTSNKPDHPPCEVEGCTAPTKQGFFTAPELWIPGVNKETVLDYPGSKRLKAGYVHHMVDPGVKKVSSGYGGVLNPSFKERHPLAKVVQPDWKAPKEQ